MKREYCLHKLEGLLSKPPKKVLWSVVGEQKELETFSSGVRKLESDFIKIVPMDVGDYPDYREFLRAVALKILEIQGLEGSQTVQGKETVAELQGLLEDIQSRYGKESEKSRHLCFLWEHFEGCREWNMEKSLAFPQEHFEGCQKWNEEMGKKLAFLRGFCAEKALISYVLPLEKPLAEVTDGLPSDYSPFYNEFKAFHIEG